MAVLLAGSDDWRENLTWARVGCAVLFLPGTVFLVLAGILTVVLVGLWDLLDRPIRKG